MRRVGSAVRLVVAGAVAACLAGCTAQATGAHNRPGGQRAHIAAKGEVTGMAAACTGLGGGITSARPVTVFAIGSRGAMTRQTIASGTTYLMRLPAGSYRIGLASSATLTQHVLVRAGQTTVVNFPDVCD